MLPQRPFPRKRTGKNVGCSTLEECLRHCGPRALILALDQVQHRNNIGLLLQSALAVGAAGVSLSAHGGGLLGDAVLRSSAGAALRIPIVESTDFVEASRVKRTGILGVGFGGAGTDGFQHALG